MPDEDLFEQEAEPPRKRGPSVKFKPWPPVIARAIVEQVQVLLEATPQLRIPIEQTPGCECLACNHPERKEIDFLLLIGAPQRFMLPYLPTYLNYKRFNKHRDGHLVPLIENYLIPRADVIKFMPFPLDGDHVAKGKYYLFQHMALYYEALAGRKFQTANSILREMREVDKEYLSKSPEHAALAAPVPPQELESFPEHQDNLDRAYARSSAKREDVVEDVIDAGNPAAT